MPAGIVVHPLKHLSRKHRVVYGDRQEQKPEHERSDMKTDNDVLKNAIDTDNPAKVNSSLILCTPAFLQLDINISHCIAVATCLKALCKCFSIE
jgi:hypothetical protein